MKKTYLAFIFSICCLMVYSQQLPQFTQFNHTSQYINPAATGATSELIFGLMGRHQWIGLENDRNESIYPKTYLFMMETPLHFINSGIGITAYSDQIGFDEVLNIRLNYAYQFKIGTNNLLGLGAAFDYQRHTMNLEGYGFIPDFDMSDNKTSAKYDFGAGIYFSNLSGFYIGLSAHNILQSYIDIGDLRYRNSTQYQLVAGSKINITESQNFKFDILPSLLIKTADFVPPQYDLNALFLFNEVFYTGVMYRYEDATGILLGFLLNRFKIGLAYDYTLSSLQQAGSKGSFEVMLAYRRTIEPRIKWRSLYNTRDL